MPASSGCRGGIAATGVHEEKFMVETLADMQVMHTTLFIAHKHQRSGLGRPRHSRSARACALCKGNYKSLIKFPITSSRMVTDTLHLQQRLSQNERQTFATNRCD
jgi:hypothetical protein